MPVNHIYVSPISDGTNTQLVRPSDWNSVHALTLPEHIQIAGNIAGTTADISSGTVVIAGGNNITLSQIDNNITISGVNTYASTAFMTEWSLAAGNSAGTNVLALSNNIFYLAGGNNITLSGNGSTLTIVGANTYVSSAFMTEWSLAAGNSAGTNVRALSDNIFYLAGGNNITLSGNGSTLTIVGANTYVSSAFMTEWSLVGNNSAGTTTQVLSNNIIYLSGGNNITLSGNVSTIVISGANTHAQQTGISVISADGSYTSGTVRFSGSGNVSVYTSGAGQTLIISGSQSVQTSNVVVPAASNSTITSGTAVFSGSTNLTVSYNGQSILFSVANQTSYASSAFMTLWSLVGVNTLGTTTQALSDNRLYLSGGNNITLSGNASTIVISGANTHAQQTGVSAIYVSNSTYSSGTVQISGANNITVSYNASTILISGANTYASSNFVTKWSLVGANTAGTTTQAISDNVIYLSGGNNITLSGNASTIVLSAGAGGGGIASIAGNNTTYTSGLVILSASTNITVCTSVNAGSQYFQLSCAAPGAGGGIGGLANTVATTYTSGTIYLSEMANMTICTSVNGASQYFRFSVNPPGGGAAGTGSYFDNVGAGITLTASLTNGSVYFMPFWLTGNLSIIHARLPFYVSNTMPTSSQSWSVSVSAGVTSSATGSARTSGTVMLFSQVDTGANSTQLISFWSSSYSMSMRYLASLQNSTNASSATARLTTSMEFGWVGSQFNSTGETSGSFGSSSSTTWSSTSTNANSFSSSFAYSGVLQMVSGIRALMVGMRTSLAPGVYWLVHIMSTSSASTNYSLQRPCMLPNANFGALLLSTNTSWHADIGNSVLLSTSGLGMPGLGYYSASSQTSTTIPWTQITNMSNYQTVFMLVGMNR